MPLSKWELVTWPPVTLRHTSTCHLPHAQQHNPTNCLRYKQANTEALSKECGVVVVVVLPGRGGAGSPSATEDFLVLSHCGAVIRVQDCSLLLLTAS